MISRNEINATNETKSKQSGTTAKTIVSKTICFEENKDGNFMSIVTKSQIQGPNTTLAKGPRDDLLL